MQASDATLVTALEDLAKVREQIVELQSDGLLSEADQDMQPPDQLPVDCEREDMDTLRSVLEKAVSDGDPCWTERSHEACLQTLVRGLA